MLTSQYGNKNPARYVKRHSAKDTFFKPARGEAPKCGLGAVQRDSTRTKRVEKYPPELMQAAQFLGMSPKDLLNKLQNRPASAGKLAQLQAKFN